MTSDQFRKLLSNQKTQPVRVPFFIKSDATTPTKRYIIIPFRARLLGGKCIFSGTVDADATTVSVTQMYASAGNLANVNRYFDPISATELSRVGITATAVTTLSLLMVQSGAASATAINTLYEFVVNSTAWAQSGAAADTGAPTGTSVRNYFQFVDGDIIEVKCVTTDDSAAYCYGWLDFWIDDVATTAEADVV